MTDSHLLEKCLSSESVFKGKLLDVYLDKIELPNGDYATREYIKHPGAVAMIAVTSDNLLLFERQYRYPMQKVMLEIPAGKIELGENTLNTAKRELLEETGYTASSWQLLGTINNCVSYSDEKILIYLAEGLEVVSKQQLDHGEFLDVLTLSLKEANQAVLNGKITDAKTISALYFYQKYLHNKTS